MPTAKKSSLKLRVLFFTVMIIPHSERSTFRLLLSLPFLLFCFLTLTTVTLSAAYVMFKYFNYWGGELKTEITKTQIEDLSSQIRSMQSYLEEVHARDNELRGVLEIQKRSSANIKGFLGGPNPEDASRLSRLLNKKAHELNIKDLNYQIELINKEIKYRISSIEEIDNNVSNQRLAYRAIPNLLPCVGEVASNFGMRIHPFTKTFEPHEGIDIAGSFGSPIYAAADGVVVETDWIGNYGRLVVIEHNFRYETRYAHLSKILVYRGQRVTRGQKIGLMGDTGRATCTHLHYEVRRRNVALNPVPFLSQDVYFSRKFKSLF